MSTRKWTLEEFKEAVRTSYMVSEVLRKLNIQSNSSYLTFKKYVAKYNIDTSHFLTGKDKAKLITQAARLSNEQTKSKVEDLLVKDTYMSTKNIKNRLLKEGILINSCSICSINEWLDKPLSLHLDHINGEPSDNRIENLRLLCPNCHSQTDTYCGRNVLKKNIANGKAKAEYKCIDCGIVCHKNSLRCKPCYNKQPRNSWIEWPPMNELLAMIENFGSILKTAKHLGVSDNAIRRHIKTHS